MDFVIILICLLCAYVGSELGFYVGKKHTQHELNPELQKEVETLISIYVTGNNLDSMTPDNCEVRFTRNDVVSILVSTLERIQP